MAVGGGLAVSLAFPGAYGIGNAVPLIGLGIAIAYRFRDRPVVCAVGLALATAPKASGALLLVPFLLAGRLRHTAAASAILAVLAATPLSFRPDVWTSYFGSAPHAIEVSSERADNAALLTNASEVIGRPVAVVLIVAAGVVLSLRRRNLF